MYKRDPFPFPYIAKEEPSTVAPRSTNKWTSPAASQNTVAYLFQHTDMLTVL
jgi:hypothetical protein